ncbi:LAETG motif-containing sortase-dependent surface protein [Kitasatospora sp. NPDC050543]|uniref:LAETG motif-containing sortase-dependent surface protein n=1 Tax=Kitasatospora sp. NPDC050543 TaxID=3364054 RepID=UPI0037A08CD0
MARQVRTLGAALAVVTGVAVLVPGVLATSASAHTPTWQVTCDKIVIDLKNYKDDHGTKNVVSLTVDGKKVLDQHQFGGAYHETFPVAAHSAPVKATLVVTTTEDPKNPDWNKTETKTIEVCQTPSPSPTATKTSTPTPTPTVTTSAPTTPAPTTAAPTTTKATAAPTVSTSTPAPPSSPATTTAAPAVTAPVSTVPSPNSPALAQTGGNDATPIVAAAGAGVVVVGGGLLLLARRRRAAGRH